MDGKFFALPREKQALIREIHDIQLTCPVLILAEEKDRTGKAKRYCMAWAEREGYPLETIPGAAYTSNLGNPDAVNGGIGRFLGIV